MGNLRTARRHRVDESNTIAAPVRQLRRAASSVLEELEARQLLSASPAPAAGPVPYGPDSRIERPGTGAGRTPRAGAGRASRAGVSHLTIVPSFDTTITTDPNAATIESTIRATIAVYSAKFATPITVYIDYAEMSGGLGASDTFYDGSITYSSFLAALKSHATTADDATALARLPAGPANPVNGSNLMSLTLPDARALGFNDPSSASNPDGTISLNTSITNLSRSGTQDPGKYDLMATIEHETDEVLGAGSDLSGPASGSPAPTDGPAPEDLFRYSATGSRSFTNDSSSRSYFSLDGATDLAQFNQDPSGDYGDWYSVNGGQVPQVQDAFATPGAAPDPGVELRVLDAIGYAPVAATPVVTGVSVGSTQWSSGFTYASGYAVPTGSSQLTDLPWVNLNQVKISFNEAVNVTQGSLAVTGVNTASYAISGFSYNAATFTATWTFAAPLGADKLKLDLAATGANAVTSSTGGAALDGTFTNGSGAFPTGGNAPGTDFAYHLNVLPGDVQQKGGPVNILEVIQTRNAQLQKPGDAGYSPFYDVDGSGGINILDVIDVRNRQLSSLPTGTP